jgi:two-component system chemotaxis response regulator CheV
MAQTKTNKSEILLESGTNELEVIEFTIANRHFGINVAKVEEILRYNPDITPMPHSNPFVEGVFKPRDMIITIINLAAYLGLSPSENADNDILVITNFNRVNSAFHVHSVDAIHRISWSDIEKPDPAIYGGEEGVATGIARFDNRLITILDFEKILADISPASGIQMSEIEQFSGRGSVDKRVLIAEDSPTLQRMILQSLGKAGYINTTLCANGEEAWRKLQQAKSMELNRSGVQEEPFSAVITDIEMPRMDGHRLLKLVRGDPVLNELPIIIFSSLINEQMYLKGQQLGATAQITKPDIGKLVYLLDKYAL